MTEILPEKGCLLIAEPTILNEQSFNRAIILLTEHNKSGSVGFVINKPLSFTINELIPDIQASFTVFNGGPVEQDNLYFIHNVPHLINNSIEIDNGIYWGGDFEITKKHINDGLIISDNIKFFLGYSGWEIHQLEAELADKYWVITPNIYKEKIISKKSKDFWKEKLQELGGEYILFSNAPENPCLN